MTQTHTLLRETLDNSFSVLVEEVEVVVLPRQSTSEINVIETEKKR